MTKKPVKEEAVALRYRPGDDPAPRVVAKGKGEVARRILEIARQHKVPCVQDPSLVQALSDLQLEAEIPPELYRAVAEILVFIYRVNDRS